MCIYNKIKVGISSCLLGQTVRYDGGHKRDAWITQTLGQYFEFLPLCPEVGAGLGIPRPTMHLVRQNTKLRAVNIKDENIDNTDVIVNFGHQVAPQLTQLCGYILKKNSPSCGMERVKVYANNGEHRPPERNGVGIFAAYLRQYFPLLPLEEEGRLCDPVLRENFIERVFVYQRWQTLEKQGLKPADLVNFHADHKYIFMAHDQINARELGHLVAQAGNDTDFAQLTMQYIQQVMHTLEKVVTRGQHTNVLMHLTGYLKPHLDKLDREELLETIHAYRLGYVPLIVPITLIKHHFRRYPQPYIQRQHYLNPHPSELMLRNAV